MFTDEEVLEVVIRGYEQLKVVAIERGITVDELMDMIKERMNGGNEKCSKAKVRVMEVRGLTNFESNEVENKKLTKFFPISGNNKKNLLNIGKVNLGRIKMR